MIDRNSRKNSIIVILLILTLISIGGCVYLLFFKENNSIDTKCKNIESDKKENSETHYKIEVYGKKYDSGAYYICHHQNNTDDCKNILFSINTESANAQIIASSLLPSSSFQYVIYNDNGIKLYNVKEESIKNIEIDINGNIEWLPEGFIFNGDEEAFYYDLKLDKKTLDKYDEIYPMEDIHDSSYRENLKYVYCKKGNTIAVIDFKTGNVIITIDNKDYEGIEFIKDGGYIIASLHGVEDTKNIIYNTKGEKIVELENNQTYETQGSKLIIYEYTEKKVKEY